ncbi:MAG TPA: hypothetical protein VFS31_15085 [Chitinophagaceae bacterium]|jgi:hypothetical protein|nr:hypothetical protein [Chitinophagaceae bacterium]
MTRLLLALSVVVFTVIGSAFTKPVNIQSALPELDLYWYYFNGTTIDHTQPINGEVPATRTYLLNNPSLLPCEIGNSADCVRGFTTKQTSDVSMGQSASIQKQ